MDDGIATDRHTGSGNRAKAYSERPLSDSGFSPHTAPRHIPDHSTNVANWVECYHNSLRNTRGDEPKEPKGNNSTHEAKGRLLWAEQMPSPLKQHVFLKPIFTDVQFWVPVGVLILGVGLLAALR